MRRGLIGGGVLAVLWLICGWAPQFLYSAGGSLTTLSQFIPSPMARGVFGSPVLWAVIVQVLMAAVLVAGFTALATSFSSGRGGFAVGWLAAILISFAIGAALDIGNFVSWLGAFGVRGAIGTMGAAPLTTWWAVLVGWLPALVWVRAGRRRGSDTADSGRAADETVVIRVVSLIAAFALIALPFAAKAGDDATQQRLRDERAAAQTQADPEGAAAPDASISGDPVPTSVPVEGQPVEGACTSADTTILAPAPDAATGHRGQRLSLVNVSEEPCIIDGYPDIAYGDQNEHLLDVNVEHGRSFMAEDPGASPITLQPGDSASAVIGWDANSVNDQLAARSLWIAVLPGQERLSWEVTLDIVAGATVHVTAWQAAAQVGD